MDVFCAPVECEFGEVYIGSGASKVLRDFFKGGGAAGGEGGGVWGLIRMHGMLQ